MRLTLVSAVLLAVSTMVSAAPHLQQRAVSCTVVSSVCGKGNGNGAAGACCTSDNDCKDTCNSSGCGVSDGSKPKSTCANGSTTTLTVSTTTTTTKPTIPTPAACKAASGVCGKGKGNGATGQCCTSDNDCQDTCNSSGCGVSDGSKPKSTCANGSTTTLTVSTTTTTTTKPTTPTPAACKAASGVCGKGKGNGATGQCCTSDNDCQDTCNSSGCGVSDGSKPQSTCANGSTTTLTVSTTTTTTTTTKSTTPTPAACKIVTGVCGKSKGNGATGACCTSDNDCQDTCNSSGCGVSDGSKPQPTCAAAPVVTIL